MGEALRLLTEAQTAREELYESSGLAALDQEIADVEAAIKKYVVDKGDFEDDQFKVTRVVSHKRWWDVDRLAKIMPKGMFLKVVDYVPVPEKIDALVKAGKIDAKTIAPAYIEKPNTPYAKITKKSSSDGAGKDEASSLAAKLK